MVEFPRRAIAVIAALTLFAVAPPSASGLGAGGHKGNDYSNGPSAISGDGRYLAFQSFASNLTPDDTVGYPYDIFRRNLDTGTTELISRADGVDGPVGSNPSCCASISNDGRFVAFRSSASHLVPDDFSTDVDVFVRDALGRIRS